MFTVSPDGIYHLLPELEVDPDPGTKLFVKHSKF
jgi:hypothetical protein